MVYISPSILACDFAILGEQVAAARAGGADFIHVDVMDGIFVPNISFGCPVIDSIKKHTSLPLDIHLMIDRPLRYIADFAKYADYLGFHFEAGSDVSETLEAIHSAGCKTCLTIKSCTEPEEIFEYLPQCDMVLVMSVEPGFGGQSFMPSALDKLRKLRAECDSKGLNVLLEVDGGVNEETGKQCVSAGADVLVVGSALFKASDLSEKAREYMSL